MLQAHALLLQGKKAVRAQGGGQRLLQALRAGFASGVPKVLNAPPQHSQVDREPIGQAAGQCGAGSAVHAVEQALEAKAHQLQFRHAFHAVNVHLDQPVERRQQSVAAVALVQQGVQAGNCGAGVG